MIEPKFAGRRHSFEPLSISFTVLFGPGRAFELLRRTLSFYSLWISGWKADPQIFLAPPVQMLKLQLPAVL